MSMVESVEHRQIAFEDQQALAEAVRLLEYTSFAGRMTNLVGSTVGVAGGLLPKTVRGVLSIAVNTALNMAMKTALRGMRGRSGPASHRLHASLATLSGAAGGAFGAAALPVELPISTILIFRAIADIARSEGEDLHDAQTAIACMEVFALGGRSVGDDHIDSGYFAVRGLLAKTVTDATKFLAAQGAAKDGAPILVKLISEIAARFGIIVSQKLAAQAIPVIGAVAGASINYAFMAHFQGLARGHFTVRRLERLYGEDNVRAEYEKLAHIWREFQKDPQKPAA